MQNVKKYVLQLSGVEKNTPKVYRLDVCLFSGNCYIHINLWGCHFLYFFQAFFQRWWAEKSPTIQAIVHKLVDSGQLEFMYGMWLSLSIPLILASSLLLKLLVWILCSEMVGGVCMMKLLYITLTWLIRPHLVTGWLRNSSTRLQELAGKLILLAILQFKHICLEQRYCKHHICNHVNVPGRSKQ